MSRLKRRSQTQEALKRVSDGKAPLPDARWSAVLQLLFWTSASALAANSALTTGSWPPPAALCNAVAPFWACTHANCPVSQFHLWAPMN